jgi:hypothetical protein
MKERKKERKKEIKLKMAWFFLQPFRVSYIFCCQLPKFHLGRCVYEFVFGFYSHFSLH